MGVDEWVYAPCEHPELTGEIMTSSKELEVDNFPRGRVGSSVSGRFDNGRRCVANTGTLDISEGVRVGCQGCISVIGLVAFELCG